MKGSFSFWQYATQAEQQELYWESSCDQIHLQYLQTHKEGLASSKTQVSWAIKNTQQKYRPNHVLVY